MIKVNDMNCEHCVHTITKALKKAKIKGEVDLNTKSVTTSVEDELKASEAISLAGYTPEIIG
jgi:copper chaperone CopZ